MTLVERIEQDIKKAMIAKDAPRLEVTRSLKSALKYVAIEKKIDRLTDADSYLVIQKQIKQRRESAEQFKNAGRTDLSDKESSEILVLETYLPKQLSEAELDMVVRGEIEALGTSSKKDFGRLMKILTEKLSGQAEARRISECLNRSLR